MKLPKFAVIVNLCISCNRKPKPAPLAVPGSRPVLWPPTDREALCKACRNGDHTSKVCQRVPDTSDLPPNRCRICPKVGFATRQPNLVNNTKARRESCRTVSKPCFDQQLRYFAVGVVPSNARHISRVISIQRSGRRGSHRKSHSISNRTFPPAAAMPKSPNRNGMEGNDRTIGITGRLHARLPV